MPWINAALIQRLEKELRVKPARIYKLIQNIVSETMLDRHLAALVLASRNGISIQKYSSPEERAQIRGAISTQTAAPTIQAQPPSRATKRELPKSRKQRSSRPLKGNSVFVVHGRNEAIRRSIFEFLRALDLQPKEWEQAVREAKGANPYVGQIIDAAMQKVQAVIVVLSPDDEARLKEEFCTREEKRSEGRLQGQPRPNVLFEAGLALGRHPEKTLLIQVGKVRGFSDIAGKHILRLTDDAAKRSAVANRLAKICTVNMTGSDWLSAGKFDLD